MIDAQTKRVYMEMQMYQNLYTESQQENWHCGFGSCWTSYKASVDNNTAEKKW